MITQGDFCVMLSKDEARALVYTCLAFARSEAKTRRAHDKEDALKAWQILQAMRDELKEDG